MYIVRVLAMGRSPVQGVPPKYLKDSWFENLIMILNKTKGLIPDKYKQAMITKLMNTLCNSNYLVRAFQTFWKGGGGPCEIGVLKKANTAR
jgi:hypothetical protein